MYRCKHNHRGRPQWQLKWAYIRVGVKTHILWMKGKGKDLSYVNNL